MRRVLKIALATAAMGCAGVAAPAYAAVTPSSDPCTYTYLTGAVACVGYVGGNLLTGTTGSATTAAEQTWMNQLLSGPATTSGGGYTPPYSLSTGTVLAAISGLGGSATLDFGTMLSGWTVVGAHFGNSPDTNTPNVTAFWLIDITTPTDTLTLANGQGSSNAQVFATAPVPEPATWGLMLLGFAGIGTALRRSRRRTNALLQVA